MPNETHAVAMSRRMSTLPRRFDPDAPRPARRTPPAPAEVAPPAPEPVVDAQVVEPHTPGEPLTLGQLRTIIAVDPAASGDADAVVYGTVDGHGHLVDLRLAPYRTPPEQAVSDLAVREPDKATTIVVTQAPTEDPLQVGLAAMNARRAAAVPRRPR